MSKRTINLVLKAIGLILIVTSLGADLIGIGSYPGINWAQLVGAVVGLVVLVYGFWLSRSS
jgi:uncharacterized membrane protein